MITRKQNPTLGCTPCAAALIGLAGTPKSSCGCSGNVAYETRPTLGHLDLNDTPTQIVAAGIAVAFIALWWRSRPKKVKRASKYSQRRAAIRKAKEELKAAKGMPLW